MQGFPFFPDQASTFASQIDLLYFVLLGISFLFAVLLPLLIIFLVMRYHRSRKVDRSNPVSSSLRLELTWTIIPLVLTLGAFFWGAFLFVQLRTPPPNTLDVYVIGKQWMWHVQHSNGKRENNELHVPIGQPVRLIMTAQDVIHSFYIPAFRIKQDVLPGRYTTLWFEATQIGEHHLFCAEYCGTEHSLMTGTVTVMSLSDYQAWLTTPGEVIMPDGSVVPGQVLVNTNSVDGDVQLGSSLSDPMVLAGEQLFTASGCVACHVQAGGGTGPSLRNVFGYNQPLTSGATVLADENYVRTAILNPLDHVVQGYQPVMPSYAGQLSEDQINQLLAYIKSLSSRGTTAPALVPTLVAATPTTAPESETRLSSVPFDANLAGQGEQLFTNLGCISCHQDNGLGLGPSLHGIYKRSILLADGSSVTADEAYLRESILNSTAKVVQGYNPIMPAYAGQLKADEVNQLVEYIKSRGTGAVSP